MFPAVRHVFVSGKQTFFVRFLYGFSMIFVLIEKQHSVHIVFDQKDQKGDENSDHATDAISTFSHFVFSILVVFFVS